MFSPGERPLDSGTPELLTEGDLLLRRIMADYGTKDPYDLPAVEEYLFLRSIKKGTTEQ
jgi:hypothetical protein